MDLTDLTEEQISEVKNRLLEEGTIFECKKTNGFDAKFFETVTVSNALIKFFLFFCLGIYAAINLAGIIYSFFKHGPSIPIGQIIGLFAICFIVFAIFANINTNKKKEENLLLIKDDKFIFNFFDGVVETPNLFYALPCDSLTKIEFGIYKLKKGQIFGGAAFTFDVSGYNVYHIFRFTNLSEIEDLLRRKFPALADRIIIDGKGERANETVKNKQKLKCYAVSFALATASFLLFFVPTAIGYKSPSLILSAVVLSVSAVLVFLARFLYTYHLIQGIVISGIFVIMGFFIPLLIVERSGSSVLDYIASNCEILLPTVFGVIGLCLYAYSIAIVAGKIGYVFKKKFFNAK